MRPSLMLPLDAEIELTAQELLAPLGATQVIEVDDIIALETTCEDHAAANAADAPSAPALDETSEIELTPEQMDAMLEGRWP
jgi:hypothetical protein